MSTDLVNFRCGKSLRFRWDKCCASVVRAARRVHRAHPLPVLSFQSIFFSSVRVVMTKSIALAFLPLCCGILLPNLPEPWPD